MTSSASAAPGTPSRRIAATCAVLGLATIGIAAAPRPANAWWHYGWGVGVYAPPVVVAPAPAYYPRPAYYYGAPAYYAPPARAWIPAHWQNGYWVPGHWG